MQVDFLTEKWEKDWYANALKDAEEWGKKTEDKKKKNNVKYLMRKYNN